MKTKALYMLLWSIIVSTTSYSQLDSLEINTNFSFELDLENPGDSIECLHVNIWFSDSTDVGSIEIDVYDTSGVEFLGYLKEDSTAFQTYYAASISDFFTFPILGVDSIGGCLVKVTVTNSDGFFLPEEEITIIGSGI